MAATLLMLLAVPALAGNEPVTVIAHNGTSDRARDIGGTALPAGTYIQLIAGNSVVAPLATGEPGVGNTLLGTNTLNGSGTYAFSVDNVTPGTNVFLRVWNTTSWPPAVGTFYGNSGFHSVAAVAPMPDEWTVGSNIDANRVIAVTSGISPASRGQGCVNQTITITGQYFQDPTTVTFSDNSDDKITYATHVDSDTQITLTPFHLDTTAATTARLVTVTNQGAIPSNAQTFTVLPGPHPTTPVPGSLFTGDSAKTVQIGGSGFHSNAQVSFSDGGKISYTTDRSGAPTSLTLSSFQILPSANLGGRIVTVLNPNDAGQDTTSFTVSNPYINRLTPNTGYLGNQFTVTAEGIGTHFYNGTTTVALGSLAIGPVVTVTVPPTHVTFTVTVPPNAAVGGQNFTATTPNVVTPGETEQKSLAGAFTLTAPSVVSVIPSPVDLGTTVNVTITGLGTHFRQGNTTVVIGGANVTVNSVTVNSVTSLVANISIAPGALTGARTVTVTTTPLDVGGTESVAGSITVQTPSVPGQVTNLRALADPLAGSITLKWTNPGGSYNGARIVSTESFPDWNSLTENSAGPLDLPGVAGLSSEVTLTGLSTSEVYYYKVFSYRESGIKFFNTNGVKVAAVAMREGGGGGTLVLPPTPLTFETDVHGVNLFSMPFPPPWYIYDPDGNPVNFLNSAGIWTDQVRNGYDLIKAINTAAVRQGAAGNVVSTFGRFLGPHTVDMQGVKIASNNPDPLLSELAAIPLINGGGYQVYIVGIPRVTIVVRNIP